MINSALDTQRRQFTDTGAQHRTTRWGPRIRGPYLTVQVFLQVCARYTEGTRALVRIVTLTLVPRKPFGLTVTLPVERFVVTLHSRDDFSRLRLRLHLAVTDRSEPVQLGFTPARLTMVVLARRETFLLFLGETLSFG